MSYSTIAAAVQTRIAAHTAHAHDYQRWSIAQLGTAELKDLIIDTTVTPNAINTWFVTRSSTKTIQAKDDDVRRIRRHSLQLKGYYSVHDSGVSSTTTEMIFNNIVDAIVDDFASGDRTLGSVALTHDIPETPSIDSVYFGTDRVLCHAATMKMQIDEVLGGAFVSPIIPTTPIPPTSGQFVHGKVVGDQIIAWMAAQTSVQALNLVTFDWASQLVDMSHLYPTNPYTDCPRMFLRQYIEDIAPGSNLLISEVNATYSLWYYTRQQRNGSNQRMNHQVQLLLDSEAAENPWIGNWRADKNQQGVSITPGIVSPGLVIYDMQFGKPVTHDELKHDFDDPFIRVSVFEIPLRLHARIQKV